MRKQRKMGNQFIFGMAAAALATMMTLSAEGAGLNNKMINTGDQVDLHFTCKFKNGQIAVSTLQSVANDSTLPKAWIFAPSKGTAPLKITAGALQKGLEKADERGFEGEVIHQLSQLIVGHSSEEKPRFELKTEKYPEKREGEYRITIPRIRERVKEMRFTPEEYRMRTGSAPEIGRKFIFDPALPGKIESVTEKEVVVRFEPEPGREILTPFGKGTLRETKDKWEIVIESRKGDIVRTGGMIGIVTAIDDKEMTLDYSHPFAYESLFCEVMLESINTGVERKSETEVQKGVGKMFQIELPPAPNKVEAGKEEKKSTEVKKDDWVEVHYTATLEDGSLIYTTRSEIAQAPGIRKAPGYIELKVFSAEEIIAGGMTKVPGVGQAVVGMALGEKKKIIIPPEAVSGPSDPEKIKHFPRERIFPQPMRMIPITFFEQFKKFPLVGSEVVFSSFLKAKVREVSETMVLLDFLVKDGDQFEEEYGTIEIKVKLNEIVVTVDPRIGAPFKLMEGEGRVARADEKTFTVDFNPPLPFAGNPILVDLEVISAAHGSLPAITWTENHDEGLTAATRGGKPAILVLYADWCSWCKKLFNESFQDPRIRKMQDQVVWIKLNSDKQKEYKEKYKQDGFPMIIFFGTDGKISSKVDGYLDAPTLRNAITRLINKPGPRES